MPKNRKQYQRERDRRLQAAGLCVRCRKPIPANSKTARCSDCLYYTRTKSAEFYASRKAKHLCWRCGVTMSTGYKYVVCESCHTKYGAEHREQERDAGIRLKAEVMQAYGGQCACCHETEISFLTLDHINDDGNTHRKLMGNSSSGTGFYRKLRAEGFPNNPPLQVLCWNCNLAKHQRGSCPHQS